MSNTPRCDHCGSHRLTGPCLRCGAPVCCEMCCKIDSLERELAAALAGRDKALVALRKYGIHPEPCASDPRPKCTCGLDETLKECGK